MRIVAGRFRGRALAALGKGDPAAHLRPTTDRVRESLFNILTGGRVDVAISGAHVLDVFAGTGALGLEALSRGAAHVTFIENGTKALSVLRRNIALLGVEGQTTVERRDATRPGPSEGPPHDLVFLDPPYAKGLGELAVAALIRGGWLAPDACLVWEEAVAPDLPEGAQLLDQRRYGDTIITIARLGGG